MSSSIHNIIGKISDATPSNRIEFENKLKEKIRSSVSQDSPKTLRKKIEALLESN